MFCPYCGAKSQASGALFCFACGRALAGDNSPVGVVSKAALVTGMPNVALWKSLPFWLFVVSLVGCAAAYVLPAVASTRPTGNPEIAVMFVMAAWFSFLWRRLGRNLWSGLLIGLAVGFTIGILARVAAATYARNVELRENSKTVPMGYELMPDPSNRLPSRWLEYPEERAKVYREEAAVGLPFEQSNNAPAIRDDPLGLDGPPARLPSADR